MKRLIAVLVVSVLGIIPAVAAQKASNSSISDFVHRVVQSTSGSSNVEWVRLVRGEEKKLQPGVTGASFYTFSTTNFEQQKVLGDKALFEFRKDRINKALEKNHTLSKYELVVPNPADLTGISNGEVNDLIGFLEQPKEIAKFDKSYTPYSVKLAEKAVVEIKLLTPNKNILILRVDCLKSRVTDDGFKKVVYFFLNEY